MKPIYIFLAGLTMSRCMCLASEWGTLDRTLPVTGEVELDVVSNPGGVTISTGSVASVRVRAVIKPISRHRT